MGSVRAELNEHELSFIKKALESYLENSERPEDEMQDAQREDFQMLIDRVSSLLDDAKKPRFHVWDAHKVNSLKVGDLAPDCFGTLKKVVEISFRGVDVEGRAYVGYTTEFGPNSIISNSMKEGKILRTVELSKYYTSAQIDEIEKRMAPDGKVQSF